MPMGVHCAVWVAFQSHHMNQSKMADQFCSSNQNLYKKNLF